MQAKEGLGGSARSVWIEQYGSKNIVFVQLEQDVFHPLKVRASIYLTINPAPFKLRICALTFPASW
jgi:hypothetical protein